MAWRGRDILPSQVSLHYSTPGWSSPQTVEVIGIELQNYCKWLRQLLLRQPWEQSKYPLQFEDGYTTGGNNNILTHSYPIHYIYHEKHMAKNTQNYITWPDDGDCVNQTRNEYAVTPSPTSLGWPLVIVRSVSVSRKISHNWLTYDASIAMQGKTSTETSIFPCAICQYRLTGYCIDTTPSQCRHSIITDYYTSPAVV